MWFLLLFYALPTAHLSLLHFVSLIYFVAKSFPPLSVAQLFPAGWRWWRTEHVCVKGRCAVLLLKRNPLYYSLLAPSLFHMTFVRITRSSVWEQCFLCLHHHCCGLCPPSRLTFFKTKMIPPLTLAYKTKTQTQIHLPFTWSVRQTHSSLSFHRNPPFFVVLAIIGVASSVFHTAR